MAFFGPICLFFRIFAFMVYSCSEGSNSLPVSPRRVRREVNNQYFCFGKPIPEEDLPNIWIKFYKVDKARTREYGGSGIGLSIVKAIMESIDGIYGVENYNNGVEFWIEL